jgi:hypothetical protein
MSIWRVLGICSTALLLWSGAASAIPLVTNGSFDNDPSCTTLPGWTPVDNVAGDAVFFNSPNCDAQFLPGIATVPTLSQDLVTSVNQPYTLSFQLMNQSAGFFGDTFTVNFGSFSTQILSTDATLGGPGIYSLFSFNVPGADITSVLTTLEFIGFVDPNNTAWNLDDVSVTAVATGVPEPPSLWVFGVALMLGGLVLRTARKRPSTP